MKKLLGILILLFALPAYGQVELARMSPAMVGGSAPEASPPAGYTDAFTNTNGVHILDHHMTGDGTSHWTAVVSSGPDDFVINTNAFYGGAWAALNAWASPSTANSSQITHKSSAPNYGIVRPCVRMPGDNQGYCAGFSQITAENYDQVSINKNGDYHSAYNTGNYATNADHTIKITATGTTTVTLEVFIDGVTLGTKTDSSSPLDVGNSGFLANNGNTGTARIMVDDYTDQ